VEKRSFGFDLTVPSVRMGGRTERLFVGRLFVKDIMIDKEENPKLGSEEGRTGRVSARAMWGCSSVAWLALLDSHCD
jgi:hypothetical protein